MHNGRLYAQLGFDDEYLRGPAQADKLKGFPIRGVVTLSKAGVFNGDGGPGKVIRIRHEIALRPGVPVFEEHSEPIVGKVKLEALCLTGHPKLYGGKTRYSSGLPGKLHGRTLILQQLVKHMKSSGWKKR